MGVRSRAYRYIKLENSKFVGLNITVANYSTALLSSLGFFHNIPNDQIVGYGEKTALEQGAIPIDLWYQKSNGLRQLKTFCSPLNVESVFYEASGLLYKGHYVVAVRFPALKRHYRY